MNIFFKLIILVFLNGISAMLSQIILFREILSQVYANELVLGIILFSWLLSGAFAGTFFYEKFIKDSSLKKIFYSMIILPVLSIITVLLMILFTRVIKTAIGIPQEIILNIWDAMLITIIVFFPINFLLTINFSFIIEFLRKYDLKKYFSLLYLFEALGAISAGVIYTFFLVGNIPNFILIYWIGIINIVVIYVIFHSESWKNIKLQMILTFILILYLLPLIINVNQKLDKKSLDFNFLKKTILFNKELKTSKITITKENNVYNVYSNGILHYSKPDERNKEFTGWAILTHDQNEKILLINGGYTGMLEEILNYKTTRKIFYIENDNEEAKVLKKFFEQDIKHKEKINFYYGDAVYYLKNNLINEKFDTMILNITLEGTLASTRYYTKEFFEILKKYLKDEGILVFSLKAGENYIDKNILYGLSSVYKTIKSVFNNVFLIPGESLYFLCCENKINITPEYVLSRISEEKVEIPTFNRKYLEKILNTEKRQYIENLLEKTKVRLNTVYSPSACFYGILSDFFYFKNNFNILKTIIMFLFFIVIFNFLIKSEELKKKLNFYINMFIISFTAIVLQMVLIFLFQSVYGYIYQIIGLLFAVFMAGIVAGCLFAFMKNIDINKIIISALFINILIILTIKNLNFILILFYLFNIGFFTGATYTIIARQVNASFLYGIDLLGGATGAFMVSVVLVPAIGIKITIILCFILIFILLFLKKATDEK